MGLLRNYERSEPSRERLLEYVLQDLTNLLNTKAGYGYFLPNLGINDYSHYSDTDQIIEVVKACILENIKEYCPVLEVTGIHKMPSINLSRINLMLDCKLRGTPCKIRVYNDFGSERWLVTD
jgi:predicted component of type VI protein secretion system